MNGKAKTNFQKKWEIFLDYIKGRFNKKFFKSLMTQIIIIIFILGTVYFSFYFPKWYRWVFLLISVIPISIYWTLSNNLIKNKIYLSLKFYINSVITAILSFLFILITEILVYYDFVANINNYYNWLNLTYYILKYIINPLLIFILFFIFFKSILEYSYINYKNTISSLIESTSMLILITLVFSFIEEVSKIILLKGHETCDKNEFLLKMLLPLAYTAIIISLLVTIIIMLIGILKYDYDCSIKEILKYSWGIFLMFFIIFIFGSIIYAYTTKDLNSIWNVLKSFMKIRD